MEAKVNSTEIRFLPYKEAGNILVTISWECSNSDVCALRSLQCGAPCAHKGVGEMAMCYAMVQGLEQALTGDPKAVSKTRVGETHYGAYNGSFSFSYSAKGSKTVLGRTLKAVCKALKPSRYATAAGVALRGIGQSASAEVKKHLVDNLQKSLAKGLNIFVVGSMKLSSKEGKSEKEVLTECLAKALEALPKAKPISGTKTALSPKEVDRQEPDGAEYKASKMDLVYLYSYLHSKLGVDPEQTNNGLMVPKMGDKKQKSLAKKKTVDAFVDAKFGTLKDKLTGAVCYYGAMMGLVDASVLASASKGITLDSIRSGLAKIL